MSDKPIIITIHIQDGKANITTAYNHKGRAGQVAGYKKPSDLLPELERMLNKIQELDIPEIETTKDDTVWQPMSAKPRTKSKSSTSSTKKKSKKVSKPKPKSPFTLKQAGKQRTLQLLDAWEIQEECMKNKNLKFNKLDDVTRIGQILANQDNTEIEVTDKNKNVVKVIKPQTEVVTEIVTS
ncbi:MAG: hypothetical protein AAFV93_21400 [Chloroflexota bacterium]